MSDELFWVIWNETCHTPTRDKFVSQADAEACAGVLAGRHHETFYVLQSVARSARPPTPADSMPMPGQP
jgi:hypothetical protein